MTKSELKTGMVVKCRDGELQMVMKDMGKFENTFLVGIHGWVSVVEFDEDLTHKVFNNSSIDTVYCVSPSHYVKLINSVCRLDDDFIAKFGYIIWKREEPAVEMTIKEIEKKLGIKNLRIKD